MAKAPDATIHLKTSHDLRNRVLGKLRTRGTTMQSFFVDIMEMIDSDDALLEMLERKRNDRRESRSLVHS
jgi:hypothetical protein